ncbi:hypothetical protein ADK41_33820 [Streptomyces caelestis]|uniref:Uncharacterized protein n=2 Tax=Streptomyces TaxID=1883 RepID=A0A0N0S5F4_9ACTN|nr:MULTISPECIES: hypothetical protein [Streptomyces]KOT29546.1 hypothetical protein ADK41_33820 [Streptomyces caelestis]KOV20049.1 hypothetical protein ADK58_35030 [Streptomyces sp. XY152]
MRLQHLDAREREALSLLLPIDDRTVLHLFQAVQEVRVGKGKDREVRTLLSFHALDVEQIGYVYEGLLPFESARSSWRREVGRISVRAPKVPSSEPAA